MHTIFHNEALRYFIDNFQSDVTTIEESFTKMQNHFITPAQRDAYSTEWSSLKLADMKEKYPTRSAYNVVDLLSQRVRDLQSLLKDPYDLLLYLRAYIIGAVENEPFYSQLLKTAIPQDPNALEKYCFFLFCKKITHHRQLYQADLKSSIHRQPMRKN